MNKAYLLHKHLAIAVLPGSINFLIFKKFFCLTTSFPTFRKWRNDYLPTFWAIGLCCCDHGGHVTSWHYNMVWNKWDRQKLFDAFNGAGDGEVYNQISFKHYREAKQYES